jgi:hypothetical protein
VLEGQGSGLKMALLVLYVVLYYLMDLVCISLTLICLTKVKVDLVILSLFTQKLLCVTFFEKICVPVKRTYTYIHSSLLVAATFFAT